MTIAPAKKAPAKKAVRPRKKAAAPAQEPLIEEPEAVEEPLEVPAGDDRPVRHNGIMIVREELVQNLPRAPFRISRLWLDNGNIAFACRDCAFTGDSRGIVMAHRNEAHGARFGQRHKHKALQSFKGTPDIVLPDEPGRSTSADPLDWTLKELLAVCPSITALGDMVEDAQRQRDAAVEELQELKIATRDMRLRAAQYDEARDELTALRNWKRKMITRLNQMGFSLSEEDD